MAFEEELNRIVVEVQRDMEQAERLRKRLAPIRDYLKHANFPSLEEIVRSVKDEVIDKISKLVSFSKPCEVRVVDFKEIGDWVFNAHLLGVPAEARDFVRSLYESVGRGVEAIKPLIARDFVSFCLYFYEAVRSASSFKRVFWISCGGDLVISNALEYHLLARFGTWWKAEPMEASRFLSAFYLGGCKTAVAEGYGLIIAEDLLKRHLERMRRRNELKWEILKEEFTPSAYWIAREDSLKEDFLAASLFFPPRAKIQRKFVEAGFAEEGLGELERWISLEDQVRSKIRSSKIEELERVWEEEVVSQALYLGSSRFLADKALSDDKSYVTFKLFRERPEGRWEDPFLLICARAGSNFFSHLCEREGSFKRALERVLEKPPALDELLDPKTYNP